MAAASLFSNNRLVMAVAIWFFAGVMLVTYGPKHFANLRGAASSTTLAQRQATHTHAKEVVAPGQTSEGKLSLSSDRSSARRSPEASSDSIVISNMSAVFGGLAAFMFVAITTTTFSMLQNVDARVRSAAPVTKPVTYVAPAPAAVAPAAPKARAGKIIPAMVSTAEQVRLTSPAGAQSDWVFKEGSAFKALAEQFGAH